MKRFLILSAFLVLTLTQLQADEVDNAFAEWKATMEFSAKRLGEVLVLSLDRAKGTLSATSEFAINDERKTSSVQDVSIAFLNTEVELEGSKQLQEPWIKIRCVKNQKRVISKRSTTVAGAVIPEMTKETEQSFFVLTCHRSELIKAKEQGEKFLSLFSAKKP